MIAFVTKMSTLSSKQKEVIFKMSSKSYLNIIVRLEFPAHFPKPIAEMFCSSATTIRTWSTFKFIHARLRTRLKNDRVNKLVLMYINSVQFDDKDNEDYILDDGMIFNGNNCE